MNKYFLYLMLSALFVSCDGNSSSNSQVSDESETENLVFFSDVYSIITNNCSACHGQPTQNGAPVSFNDYDNISQSANLILERIQLEESNPLSMPLNKEKLLPKEINTIIEWVLAGKPNN